MKQIYAYFGDGHPAESIACETCKARPHAPCTVTVAMIGTSVSIDMNSRGIHAARVHAAQELAR